MKCVLGHKDWSTGQWDQLWQAHAKHLGETMLETIYWDHMAIEEVLRRIAVRGETHLQAALGAGRGVMLFGTHLGNFTSLALFLRRLGVGSLSAGQSLPLRHFEHIIHNLCRRFGSERMHLGGVPIAAARTFLGGGAFGLFFDYSLPHRRNAWVQFGHGEINVSLGPALIALRHGVPALTLTSARGNDGQHQVTIHPPLCVKRTENLRSNALALTQQAMDILTRELAKRPEQWWVWDVAPIRPRSTPVVEGDTDPSLAEDAEPAIMA